MTVLFISHSSHPVKDQALAGGRGASGGTIRCSPRATLVDQFGQAASDLDFAGNVNCFYLTTDQVRWCSLWRYPRSTPSHPSKQASEPVRIDRQPLKPSQKD